MSMASRVYSRAPLQVQNGLVSLYGAYWYHRRYGGVFRSELAEFISRSEWSQTQWKSYQLGRLRALCTHAWDTVPLYRTKYSSAGFNRTDIENINLDSFHLLPPLTKEELRIHGTTTGISSVATRGSYFSSSGSTGTPTKIYYSQNFHQRWSAAFESRIRLPAGLNKNMPRGTIGGRRVVPEGESDGPFHRYNVFERQTYFSAYHIGPKTVKSYLDAMRRCKVEYMTGYAASNFLLAREIENAGLSAPKLKAVVTSSEKLTHEMRATFERVYGCKTFDTYSGVEACGLISETSDGELIASPDVGIYEVINDQGDVDFFGEGELVSTGLLNFDQPLIRYRIGDRVTINPPSNDQSKFRGMPRVVDIQGRNEDVIIGSDGRKMVRFHGIFIDIPGLALSQIVQKSRTLLVIRLVIRPGYDQISAERIMTQRLQSQLGSATQFIFEYPQDLSRTTAGKFQAVISEISS